MNLGRWFMSLTLHQSATKLILAYDVKVVYDTLLSQSISLEMNGYY